MNYTIEEIKNLYYKEGLSTSEVANKFGVTVWQVIKYMKKNNLRRRESQESNYLRYLRQKPSFQIRITLTNHEEKLAIAASMLYWAEGVKGKKGVTVDFPNSDPKMFELFLKYLRESVKLKKAN